MKEKKTKKRVSYKGIPKEWRDIMVRTKYSKEKKSSTKLLEELRYGVCKNQ